MSISLLLAADTLTPPLPWTNLNVNSIRINNSPLISFDSEEEASVTRTGTGSTIALSYQRFGKLVSLSIFGNGTGGVIVATGGAIITITPDAAIAAKLVADLDGLDYTTVVQCKTGANYETAAVQLSRTTGALQIFKSDGTNGNFTAADDVFPFTISFLSTA
jgi:hypothetical protein